MVFLMPEACLSIWQTDQCAWSIESIWRSCDVVERTIFISLALMLVYSVLVVLRFLYRDSALRREPRSEAHELRRSRQSFVVDLIPALAVLKGISTSAPLLGLAGTSYWVLEAFSVGFSGSTSRYVPAMIVSIGSALIPSLLGILVAIPAAFSYSLLRTRLEVLRSSASNRHPSRAHLEGFRFAQTLPLRKRFSDPPSYALIAAPVLASVVTLFTPFHP